MKPKPIVTRTAQSCRHRSCNYCSGCNPSGADLQKPVKTEVRSLYGSEVLSFYFYFYQHLATSGNNKPLLEEAS